MNSKYILFFTGVCILLQIFVSADSRQENYHTYEVFSTRFGTLTLTDASGRLSATAVDVKLDDKLLFSSNGLKNGWDENKVLMHPLYDDGLQLSKKFKPGDYPLPIDRMILMIGPDGNCIHQALIVDFTGSAPYVSEQFGYNPDGKSCLEFVKAKWGKKESYIYLKGPLKYVYYTGGKVVGPLE